MISLYNNKVKKLIVPPNRMWSRNTWTLHWRSSIRQYCILQKYHTDRTQITHMNSNKATISSRSRMSYVRSIVGHTAFGGKLNVISWFCLQQPGAYAHDITPIKLLFLNALSSEAIQRRKCSSTSTQAMACCLTAPSHHHLNQCWFIVNWISRNKSGYNYF